MESKKKLAALAALALSFSLLWAAPRSPKEFDKEAQEYRDYWLRAVKMRDGEKFGALLFLDDLRLFCEKRPKCLLSRVDFAAESLKLQKTKEGLEELRAAKKLLASVPDNEEGRFAKAKYYRLLMETSLFIWPGGKKGEFMAARAAESCADNNGAIGGQAYYTLFHYFLEKDDARSAAAYLDKLFETKGFCYFAGFGSVAASAYEKNGDTCKAILAAMLDKEYSSAYEDEGAEKLAAILKKNYGGKKGAAACIAFVQKFFDKKERLLEKDLDSLPQNVQNFLTVRYMYKMKNSGDAAALREEFEPFFGTVKNFHIRLEQKAKSE